MTRTEASKIIGHYDVNFYYISGEHEGEKIPADKLMEAFDMAIEALSQEPTIAQERYQDLCDYFGNDTEIIENILNNGEEFKKWLERVRFNTKACNELHYELEALKKQMPTEDCISRQAAIDCCRNEYEEEVEERLRKLPSVQPKHGEWKKISMDKYTQHAQHYYRCSECGEEVIGEHNYCPNCGSRMDKQI